MRQRRILKRMGPDPSRVVRREPLSGGEGELVSPPFEVPALGHDPDELGEDLERDGLAPEERVSPEEGHDVAGEIPDAPDA